MLAPLELSVTCSRRWNKFPVSLKSSSVRVSGFDLKDVKTSDGDEGGYGVTGDVSAGVRDGDVLCCGTSIELGISFDALRQ